MTRLTAKSSGFGVPSTATHTGRERAHVVVPPSHRHIKTCPYAHTLSGKDPFARSRVMGMTSMALCALIERIWGTCCWWWLSCCRRSSSNPVSRLLKRAHLIEEPKQCRPQTVTARPSSSRTHCWNTDWPKAATRTICPAGAPMDPRIHDASRVFVSLIGIISKPAEHVLVKSGSMDFPPLQFKKASCVNYFNRLHS